MDTVGTLIWRTGLTAGQGRLSLDVGTGGTAFLSAFDNRAQRRLKRYAESSCRCYRRA
jgi:hypothetical protein